MKISLSLLLSLATGLCLAPPLVAGALLNGSFENGFLGWSVSGNALVEAAAPYTPADGTKLAAFNTVNSTPNGIVSQTVSGSAGSYYKLSFDAGNLSYTNQEQKLRVKITGDGGSTTLLEEITIPGTGNGSINWVSREYQIFQPSATQTLSFEDISPTTASVDLVLDTIRLDPLLDLHVSTSADSVAPPPGPFINLSPASHEGLQGGTSPLATRTYWQGTQIIAVAPDRANGWFFQKWQKTTIAEDNSQTTVDINGRLAVFTMDQPTYLRAIYLPGLAFEDIEGFKTKGAEGIGPFTPSGKVFTLRNNAPESVPWTAAATSTTQPGWATVFPISGTLAPGATVNLQLSVTPQALNLSAEGDGQQPGNGIYHGQLQVSSPVLGSLADSRDLTLEVIPILTVTTLDDENEGWGAGGIGDSLREALGRANTLNRECITRFNPSLAGGALILGGTQLEASASNTIDASDLPGGITISANFTSRVLRVFNTPSSSGPTTVTLDNMTLLNGQAPVEDNNGSGGAIHGAGNLHLKNCTLAGNMAAGDGGAIAGSLATSTLSHCLIDGNQAAGNGGGIAANASRISLDHCTITGNTAANGGGMACTGALTITDSTISGNAATGDGGGIWAKFAAASYHYDFGALSLVNSTVANNHAEQSGGGIFDDTYDNTLVHCTVSGNTAASLGGGIHANTRKFTFTNSIVAGNFGTADPNLGGSPESPHEFAGYNLLDGNPLLAPLAYYGDAIQTMPPLPGSPAVDATLLLSSSPATDQRGAPRPTGPLPDIGATEAFPYSSLALIDTDDDGIDDRLEPAYGLSVGNDDRTRDSDGDGSTDAMEIANMTNPLDPASLLKITSFVRAPGFNPAAPVFYVTFTTFPGLSYSVQRHPGLDFNGPATISYPSGATDGHTSTMAVPMAPGQDFVRVVREK